jgi:DNA-binding HxlR family transcriptional regulator
MSGPTKIDFRHRRVREIEDITDIVAMILPGNTNQQHAAARVLLTLKAATEAVPSLRVLEEQYGISHRTLERTRAKLARVGLIECVSPLNKRSNGRHGWRLSSRMGAALRQLADKIEAWREDKRPERREKDERLVGILR